MVGLAELVAPAHTAVLTMELQRGVVGDLAMLPELADEVAAHGLVDVVARVCDAARGVGARVVHCTVEHRADGAGATVNTPLGALADRARIEGRSPIEVDTPGVELMPELGPERNDLVVSRLHGMTPFTSTSLDQILRNLGVGTVVATGVSLNLGVLGLCLSAADLGYQVVVLRDAVAAVPEAYGPAVIDHTLSLVATITTSAELVELWRARP